jgi:epoxyqueuosine reductase
MTISTSDPLPAIRERAASLGIDTVHTTAARLPATVGAALDAFLAAGRHGSMDWLARDPQRRRSPDALWPAARSAILCGLSYAPPADPLAELARRDAGYIAVYARNRDYHDILKGRLKQLAGFIAGRFQAQVKVFVDTGPLLEKPLAQQAGLGWQGKHTNVVSRRHGSWLFLGAILTDLSLTTDLPERDHCGTCHRCLDICPTRAFPRPYQLDARRCISYLTIEHKGVIPADLRPLIGNRIYGCDDCLAVCPWNRFAQATREIGLSARTDLVAPSLAELAALDDAGFRQCFSGSPIKRIGRDRFLRNVLIAIGNSGDPALAPNALARLDDASPLVRGMAVWAARSLVAHVELAPYREPRMAVEEDADVRAEWEAGA